MNYFWILDILVLIVLVLCLLGGLISGFLKSFRKLLALLIPTILLFIFLTPMTNAVMNFKVDLKAIDQYVDIIPDDYAEESYSLVDGVAIAFSTYVYQDDPTLQEDSKLQDLAISLAEMVIKIVVYFIGLLLVWLLSIILSLILKIFIGRKNGGGKLIGLGIGAARFIVVFLLLFLPLFGTLSLSSAIIHDVAEYQQPEEGSIMGKVVEIADQYENSYTKKYLLNNATLILCTDKSVSCDAQFVGGALTFKTDGKEVSIVKEYSNIKNAIPTIIKLMEVAEEIQGSEEKVVDLSQFTDEDIEALSSLLKNSELIKVAIPAILEYAAYSMRNEEGATADLIESLDVIDWDTEINGLAALIDVLKEHNDLKINVGNLDYVLKSEGLIDLVSDLATGAFQLNLVTEIGIPLVINALEEKLQEPDFSKYEINLDAVKNIKWSEEGSNFVKSALNVYKEYLKVNIDFSDLKVALNDEALPGFVDFVFEEIDKSALISDCLLPIAMQVVLANLEQNNSLENLDIDFEALKAVNWKEGLSDIKVVLHDVIVAYQVLDINPEDFKAVLKNSNLQTQFSKVVTSILDCDIVSEYILPIAMNALCDMLSKQESLMEFGFDFDQIKDANWKVELLNVKDVLIAFLDAYQGLDYNKDNWSLILDNPNLETYVDNIFNEVLKSELIKEQILKKLPFKLHSLIDGLETSMDLSFLKHLITEDSIIQLLDNDTSKLIEILKEIKSLGLFDKQQIDFKDPHQQDVIISIIKKVFDLSVVEGKEAKIFDSLFKIVNLNELMGEYGLTISYLTVTDWDQEVEYLTSLFKNVMTLTDGLESLDFGSFFTTTQTPEKKEQIAQVINSIGSSEIFGDSIYSIIEMVASEINADYVINVTPEEKNIIENVNGWYEESMHLLNIVDQIRDINFETSYRNLDANEIKELMIYCSETVVSTKLFGSILNSVFDGIVEQDFTKQEVMRNSADIVYDAITVASIVKDNNIDLNDKETTDALIDSMNSLASSEENIELINDLMNNIVSNSEPVEYDKEDIQDAANVLETVIESYQNSSDQENFDVSDLTPEQQEQIENSDIAKAIFDLLFK